MVDLGISRPQDVQNPGANLTTAQVESKEKESRQPVQKPSRRPAPAGAGEARSVDLEAEVKRLNDLLGANTRIRFVVNRSTSDVYVEVIDKETDRVLRTIPSSEVPDIEGKLSEGGILVDNRL
jgi:flagellar protein FlaG